MVWLFGDSFDTYAAIADAGQGHWDSSGNWTLNTSGRFTGSSCVLSSSAITTSTYLAKATGSNDTVIYLNFAFIQTIALTLSTVNDGMGWVLSDGLNAQVTVFMRGDGSILIKGGSQTASVIATYSSAFLQNVWTHFQCKITINNTTGRVQIRKDGAVSDSFDSGAVLNTRNGSTNAYANKISLASNGSNSLGQNQKVDDFYMFNDQGAAPNTWQGDVRAVWQAPNVDTAQKDFSPSFSSLVTQTGTAGSGMAAGASVLTTGQTKFNAIDTALTAGGTLVSATATPSASFPSAKHRMAIYSNNSGAPGTLIALSDAELTGVVANTLFTHTFTGVTLTRGLSYWIAIASDTSIAYYTPGAGTGAAGWVLAGATYPSGSFPSSASAAATGNSPAYMVVTITVDNESLVSEAVEDGDTSYVYASTVGNNDLYDVTNLASTPVSIVGLQLRGYGRKSDSGSRSGQLQLKSGITTDVSTDTVLSSSYTWLEKFYATDPNTGSAWLTANVNLVQVGPKVTA